MYFALCKLETVHRIYIDKQTLRVIVFNCSGIKLAETAMGYWLQLNIQNIWQILHDFLGNICLISPEDRVLILPEGP